MKYIGSRYIIDRIRITTRIMTSIKYHLKQKNGSNYYEFHIIRIRKCNNLMRTINYLNTNGSKLHTIIILK